MDSLSLDLLQVVIELVFISSPTAATIERLKLVNSNWKRIIEKGTTFKYTKQQPYDVVFGVLVARERPYDDRRPWEAGLIAIQPPKDAKLRLVPDNAFEDRFGLIVSVDFSGCVGLETIGAKAFTFSMLFRVNLSGCSKLRSIGSFAFGNEDLKDLVTSGDIANYSSRRLDEIFPPTEAPSNLMTLSLKGCVALQEIGHGAFCEMNLCELDLTSCVALKDIGSYAFGQLQLRNLNLSSCIALKRIGDWAFWQSELIELNTSGCAALLTIGEMSFCDAKLRTLDLSGCTALVEIGDAAFFRSPLTTLNLLVPEREKPFLVGLRCFFSSRIPGLDGAMGMIQGLDGDYLAPAVYGQPIN